MNVNFGFIVEPKELTKPLVSQVHAAELVEVKGPAHADSLRLLPPKADGVWTKERALDIYVFSADCLPVLFFGESPECPIAAVHAGWRGALAGIVRKTAQQLLAVDKKLHVVLGPCIAGCCFEVKDDFIQAFAAEGKPVEKFVEKSRGRMFFDLPRYVREVELGDIPYERQHSDENRCTYCSAPPLPSYRRNGGTDPRIRAWIRKKPL